MSSSLSNTPQVLHRGASVGRDVIFPALIHFDGLEIDPAACILDQLITLRHIADVRGFATRVGVSASDITSAGSNIARLALDIARHMKSQGYATLGEETGRYTLTAAGLRVFEEAPDLVASVTLRDDTSVRGQLDTLMPDQLRALAASLGLTTFTSGEIIRHLVDNGQAVVDRYGEIYMKPRSTARGGVPIGRCEDDGMSPMRRLQARQRAAAAARVSVDQVGTVSGSAFQTPVVAGRARLQEGQSPTGAADLCASNSPGLLDDGFRLREVVDQALSFLGDTNRQPAADKSPPPDDPKKYSTWLVNVVGQTPLGEALLDHPIRGVLSVMWLLTASKDEEFIAATGITVDLRRVIFDLLDQETVQQIPDSLWATGLCAVAIECYSISDDNMRKYLSLTTPPEIIAAFARRVQLGEAPPPSGCLVGQRATTRAMLIFAQGLAPQRVSNRDEAIAQWTLSGTQQITKDLADSRGGLAGAYESLVCERKRAAWALKELGLEVFIDLDIFIWSLNLFRSLPKEVHPDVPAARELMKEFENQNDLPGSTLDQFNTDDVHTAIVAVLKKASARTFRASFSSSLDATSSAALAKATTRAATLASENQRLQAELRALRLPKSPTGATTTSKAKSVTLSSRAADPDKSTVTQRMHGLGPAARRAAMRKRRCFFCGSDDHVVSECVAEASAQVCPICLPKDPVLTLARSSSRKRRI